MKRIFYALFFCLAWVACQDDDSFTTATGLKLDFSVDTLKLDTVFSQTPSSTYSFWVYNRNADGIRLQSVRLSRGNQSGYRVNVDGIYLDNANGSQTNQVEIRQKDSVLVFVELTAPVTQQTNPVLVEDHLLFTLESGVEQRVCLSAWTWDAKKLYAPVITKDTIIDSRVPIIIYGDMKVNEGATLTLRNTSLYFHDQSGMEVYGTLKAEGCLMRGDRMDHMFSYLPYDRISGQWRGICLYPSSTGNTLTDTEIRNPQNGIICDSAAIDSTVYRLQMQNCVVHNCKGAGVSARHANIWMESCQLTNTLDYCLSIVGGRVEIHHCTIGQFYPFSGDRGAALSLTNRYSPLDYFRCEGSIVTGYQENVLSLLLDDDKPQDYQFANCLLRTTDRTDDTLHFQQILWESAQDSIQGKQHFVLIDEENLNYNFHLDASSPAQGLGCYR